MSLDEFTNEVLEFIPIKSQAKFSSYFCFVFTSATSIKAPRRISGYCMYSIHPAGSQRIHMYPIEIETEIHENFLPRIRYGTGTTGKYRRIASTAVLAEPPSPYRRLHSCEIQARLRFCERIAPARLSPQRFNNQNSLPWPLVSKRHQ